MVVLSRAEVISKLETVEFWDYFMELFSGVIHPGRFALVHRDSKSSKEQREETLSAAFNEVFSRFSKDLGLDGYHAGMEVYGRGESTDPDQTDQGKLFRSDLVLFPWVNQKPQEQDLIRLELKWASQSEVIKGSCGVADRKSALDRTNENGTRGQAFTLVVLFHELSPNEENGATFLRDWASRGGKLVARVTKLRHWQGHEVVGIHNKYMTLAVVKP